jgi:hypothetical protein
MSGCATAPVKPPDPVVGKTRSIHSAELKGAPPWGTITIRRALVGSEDIIPGSLLAEELTTSFETFALRIGESKDLNPSARLQVQTNPQWKMQVSYLVEPLGDKKFFRNFYIQLFTLGVVSKFDWNGKSTVTLVVTHPDGRRRSYEATSTESGKYVSDPRFHKPGALITADADNNTYTRTSSLQGPDAASLVNIIQVTFGNCYTDILGQMEKDRDFFYQTP